MDTNSGASGGDSSHILILPYPSSGHINPMVQFGKRAASHGLKVSIAITRFIAKSMEADTGPIAVETISDGFDEAGYREAGSVEAYHRGLEEVGSRTVTEVVDRHRTTAAPFVCIVHDAFLPWPRDLARDLGLRVATFFTQSAAVDAIYYNVHLGETGLRQHHLGETGLRQHHVDDGFVASVGLPRRLRESDLPSFVTDPGYLPGFRLMLLSQFFGLEKADWILCNTFDALEGEVLNWISKAWGKPMRAIGPTVPSFYLDKRVEGDEDYGLSIWKREGSLCKNWLDTKPPGSVVYVSFGSAVELDETQTGELARGLEASDKNFLWVVRETEEAKLPRHFIEQVAGKGLVVRWCFQLQVLAHPAVGCFVSHCGWNSTLEAISLGVPLVAVPHWTDQPTNAKYIEDVWGVGVRVRKGEGGGIASAEIERCIKEVMDGEKKAEIRKNADRWKVLAGEAVDEGGPSDRNIREFVDEIRKL